MYSKQYVFNRNKLSYISVEKNICLSVQDKGNERKKCTAMQVICVYINNYYFRIR